MSPRTIAPLAAVVFLCPSFASAESLSVTGSGQGIGVELSGVDRSFDINGSSVKAQGALGGLYAFVQQGAGFRAEARAPTGSLAVESSDLASDETSTETKAIGGTDTSIDDIQQGTAGVRLTWRL